MSILPKHHTKRIMAHHESAAEQKCNKETGEKCILQRKWVSEPSPDRLFSDPDGKSHAEFEGLQVGMSGGKSSSLEQKSDYSEKLLSSAMSLSSQNNQYAQVNPPSYSQKLPHSYSQLIQESVLPGTKSQPSPENVNWHRKCPPSDEMHTHSQGIFPQQKSPSSPVGFVQYSQPGSEQYEEMHKKEQKLKKPGKYICNYCGRACAKPSVLKKHIRSHTGERPYPCGPCGFSFKTKSNLYKHRKSHAHAIKAGLVPFSEQAATCVDNDQVLSVGEADIHSDGEQSTDTEEETAEHRIGQIPQISFESESSTVEMIGHPVYADSSEESLLASMKVPILIIPKQGIPSTSIDCTDSQAVQSDESHAIKQRLALRLTEKKSQDSEQSLNLLSPHSKGSTDSGYFSRSESAEQQISPPNTNAKSYEEIMFGRYYRPNSRQRQSITVGMATDQDNAHSIDVPDTMLGMEIRSLEHTFLTGSELRMLPRCDIKAYDTDPHLKRSLLEAPDSGHLMRSNSVPTSPITNLNVPTGLRASHSFDERVTPDDVFYPGAAGLRRLRRQAAFEHSVHDGHVDSENLSIPVKNTIPPLKFRDRGHLIEDFRTLGKKVFNPEIERTQFVSHCYKAGVAESRKRRKEKSVGDEEDAVGLYDSSEMTGDVDSKMGQDASKCTSVGIGSICTFHSQTDSFDNVAGISSEDLQTLSDHDRKTGNVISVIQHTNSLSRPSSFEKSESIDLPSYQDKPNRKLSEHSDSINIEDGKNLRSDSIEWQQQSDGELAGLSPHQNYQMPHKLVRQPNIQVPEIRVTEEPDKPERETEAVTKEPEKHHVEEFQWPQRSETLSQLPAEKLPPKKKRLRLADMEYSSGESSFESTCTSLSRSPSQDSNLSHSSSLSMSFEKEESIKCMSPTKLEDLCRQSEFLTVPGSGYSLSIPGHHHREMRRSSSEQAPCTLPAEIPEIRSKSFDYGSLSNSSRQGELYASASSSKERRRGYLVRQASLSVYSDSSVLPEQNVDTNMKQEHSEIVPHLSSFGWYSGSITTAHGTTTSEEPTSKSARGSSDYAEYAPKESINQDALNHSSSLTFQYWANSPPHRQQHPLAYSKHHSPKVSGSHQSLLPTHQTLPQEQCDSETDRECSQSFLYPLHSHSSQTRPTSLQYTKPIVSTPNVRSDSSLSAMRIPVRIQTHVPSYSSIMYTSMSEIMTTNAQSTTSRIVSTEKTSPISLARIASKNETSFQLSHILEHQHSAVQSILEIPESLSERLNTGIPLSLTSGTISTTDASSGIGASKRMLSPASSLELFIETKQQKRVKEERMYGQIVKELSAVELSNTGTGKRNRKSPDFLKNKIDQDNVTCNFPVTKGSLHLATILPSVEGITPPILLDSQNRTLSTETLDVDCCNRETMSPRDTQSENKQDTCNKIPVNMLIQIAANQHGGGSKSTLLLTDLADVQQILKFPTLRTTTSVSWCFLNYTKPNHSQITPISSVYGSWSVSSYNPNPFSLSTKASLALLCSRQRKDTATYTTTAMQQLGSGKLVPSLLWKQRFDQLKSGVIQLDSGKYCHQKKCLSTRENGNDGHEETEPTSKQAEPTRIKIFEGGYKSNEDYVYVRGRGRGKYICEECGIRCKKPSMLKKHIRTHTDLRPYVCKFCNFAFKTKGNLTKHMKSKAHMKKCLELGVSVTCVDDVETEEADTTDDNPQESGQFVDADESEGPDDEGDEIDEDEEDEEEYDWESTPKTCSRSTSPQTNSLAFLAATVVTASQESSANFMHCGSKSPLLSYLANPPSIKVTQMENYRNLLSVPNSMDEDSRWSPDHTQSLDLSGQLSPRCDSPRREPSPTSPRYLSPRGDLSPRRRLSPRREAYHLRHLSPRRDIFHRDISPRGDHSHTNLLLPSSTMGRPTSPGRELSSRRDLSPRSRYRVRPVSPRRGLHHQSSWSLGQNLQAELVSLAQKTRSQSDTETQVKKMDFGTNSSGTGTAISHHGLFSHLPLHSQQQIHTPFTMIPIGGIQIVHSVRPSNPAHLPKQNNTSEQSNANEVPFQVVDGTVLRGRLESSQTQGNILCSLMEDQSLPSVCVHSEKSEREVDNISNKDIKQEESIHTCTKAIASLQIASEEPLEKSLSTDNLPNQQTQSTLKTEEIASIKSHPSSELNTRQSLHSSMENILTCLPLKSKRGEENTTHLQNIGGRLLDTTKEKNCEEN